MVIVYSVYHVYTILAAGQSQQTRGLQATPTGNASLRTMPNSRPRLQRNDAKRLPISGWVGEKTRCNFLLESVKEHVRNETMLLGQRVYTMKITRISCTLPWHCDCWLPRCPDDIHFTHSTLDPSTNRSWLLSHVRHTVSPPGVVSWPPLFGNVEQATATHTNIISVYQTFNITFASCIISSLISSHVHIYHIVC